MARSERPADRVPRCKATLGGSIRCANGTDRPHSDTVCRAGLRREMDRDVTLQEDVARAPLTPDDVRETFGRNSFT